MSYPKQALETILWSSIVYTSEDCDGDYADQFEPSRELVDRVGAEFTKFEDLLYEAVPDFDLVDDCKIACDEFERLEHDFILTVNGHGAGFWGGDWKSGDELTTLCRQFNEIEIYLGDDNLLYPY